MAVEETQTKTYHDVGSAKKDSQKLAKRDGWIVVSQTSFQPARGWRRWLLLGPLAIVFPPRKEVTIIYRRSL